MRQTTASDREARLKKTAQLMSDRPVNMITNVQLAPYGLCLTETDLCGWIGQAAPGEALEYYRGFLAMDTFSHGSRLPGRERTELVRVARRAWWASEQKLIHLVQRRHGPDDYSYLAIARPKPKQGSASLSSLLLAEVA
jgi:hypothetical protein